MNQPWGPQPDRPQGLRPPGQWGMPLPNEPWEPPLGWPSGPPPGPPWGTPGQPWGASPGPSVGWAVTLWVVGACCLGAALLLGVVAAAGFMIDNHMDNNGVTTTATVTDVDAGGDIAVEFWTEDDYPANARFTWWSDQYPAVDEQIEITYDPDDPSYVIQAGSDEDQVMATGFAVAAGLALVVAAGTGVGAVFVHRARAKAAARSGGFYRY